MPIERALSVMRRAKLYSVPPMASATTTATSLADLVTSARIASRTLIVLPGFRPSFEGAWEAACLETLSRLLRVKRPASICSNSM